jgi:hypothetical protein
MLCFDSHIVYVFTFQLPVICYRPHGYNGFSNVSNFHDFSVSSDFRDMSKFRDFSNFSG